MFNGIDVSDWQGKIDWEQVKNSGLVDFAMLRAGYSFEPDGRYNRNATECNRVGIPCGAYWFSYALSVDDARNEAKRCLELVKDFRLEMPIAFDLEYDTIRYAKTQGVTIDKNLASEMVKAFCEEIENAGYYAMVYSNLDYFNNMFTDTVFAQFDGWLAYYQNEPWQKCHLWQYSNAVQIPGISGNVDGDRSFLNFPELLKNMNLNRLAPEPEPEQNLDEIARLVYRGEYGNGQERFDKLREEGYDTEAVQQRVNELYY